MKNGILYPIIGLVIHMRNRTSDILFYSLNIIIPLVLGVMIYLISRPQSYVSVFVYDLFSLGDGALFSGIRLPELINNFGCDFLWGYSLTVCFFFVSRSYRYTVIVCSIFMILSELAQLLPFFRLRFDIIDIAVELAAMAIAMMVLVIRQSRQNKIQQY